MFIQVLFHRRDKHFCKPLVFGASRGRLLSPLRGCLSSPTSSQGLTPLAIDSGPSGAEITSVAAERRPLVARGVSPWTTSFQDIIKPREGRQNRRYAAR